MRIFFLSLTAGAALTFSQMVRADTVDRIMAVVDETAITSLQVDMSMAMVTRMSQEIDRQKYDNLQSSILDGFIKEQLVLRGFKDLEKKGVNIPESIIDEIIQEDIRSHYADRTDFIKKLQQEGITVDDYRKKTRESFIVQQMTLANVSEPIISPHKIEVFYQEHPNEFKVPEQVKMRVITLAKNPADNPGDTRKRADEILSKIKEGATFEEMASIYSDTKSGKDAEVPWREISKINKNITEELRKLKPGECSGVVETADNPGTYFLIKLQEWKPAHTMPLSEVRETIERTLKAQERDRLTNKWINRLKTKTFLKADM